MVVIVIPQFSGGDPSHDVHRPDVRPPAGGRSRGRHLPQSGQGGSGGSQDDAAGDVRRGEGRREIIIIVEKKKTVVETVRRLQRSKVVFLRDTARIC